MRPLLWIAVLASCSTRAGDDEYPVQPGGAGPPPTAIAGGAMTGRACVIADPRDLASCAPAGASGLAVSAGGQTVTTDAAGNFSLPMALDGGAPSLTITGNGVVPTSVPLASGEAPGSIPVLRADLFAQMLAANGITLPSGSGSILGSVIRGGNPASGVTVASTPSPAFGPLFDGTTPTSWTLDGTGARGVVWIPGIAAGPASVTLRDLATSGETTVNGVQVIDGGITIMDAVLP